MSARATLARAARLRGFTLLELLVVVAIASLTVAVVPPLVASSLPGAELKKTTRELASALKTARSLAVTRNESVSLRLDLDKNRYWITGSGNARQLPEDIDLVLYGADSEIPSEVSGGIRFFPDGSSTGGRITIARDARSNRIDVDWLLGRIVVDD
ncbi:MAG TPA: GspH/FimT family pseudopilin [Gammaproteobacteria bacterium]|nr:GspH/FimT family pseudopilin [Gammaproteobacteria bacterium]